MNSTLDTIESVPCPVCKMGHGIRCIGKDGKPVFVQHWQRIGAYVESLGETEYKKRYKAFKGKRTPCIAD